VLRNANPVLGSLPSILAPLVHARPLQTTRHNVLSDREQHKTVPVRLQTHQTQETRIQCHLGVAGNWQHQV